MAIACALGALTIGASVATAADPAPADAVQQALQQIEGAPHRLAVDGTVKVALGTQNSPLKFTVSDDFSAAGEIENPRRTKWSLSESLAYTQIPLILHDGAAFVAEAGKTRYEKVPQDDTAALQLIFEPATQRIRPTSVAQIDGLVDAGIGTVDGVTAHHYTGVLPVAFQQRLIDGVFDAEKVRLDDRTRTLASLTLTPGTVDLWTDASGALWRETLTLSVSIDVNKAAGTKPGAESVLGIDTADLDLRLSFHPSDIGAAISVARPKLKPVKRTAPRENFEDFRAQALLSLGAQSLRSYGIVTGSYAGAPRQTLTDLAGGGVTFVRSGVARSDRDQVLLRAVRRRSFVLVTHSPSGKKFTLTKLRGKDAVIKCNFGKRRCATDPIFSPSRGSGASVGIGIAPDERTRDSAWIRSQER
jgi:hypothetical protein